MGSNRIFSTLSLALLVWVASTAPAGQHLTVNGNVVKSITLEHGQVCEIGVVSDNSLPYTGAIGFEHKAPDTKYGPLIFLRSTSEAGQGAIARDISSSSFYGFSLETSGMKMLPGLHFIFKFKAQTLRRESLNLYDSRGRVVDSVTITVIKGARQHFTLNGYKVDSINLDVGQSCEIGIVSDDGRTYVRRIGFDFAAPTIQDWSLTHLHTAKNAGQGATVTNVSLGDFHGYEIETGDESGIRAGFHFVFQYDATTPGVTELKLYNLTDQVIDSVFLRVNCVGFEEVAYFASQWLKSNCGSCAGADLTSDGNVDADDVIQLVDYWLECPTDMTAEAMHWDFEDATLQDWIATGDAFRNQPTYGNNVSAWRVKQVEQTFRDLIAKIEGDYWDGPCAVGIQGEYWIGTYEDRPTTGSIWASAQGDGPRGSLLSPEFTLGKRYLHFLLGGGNNNVYIELQVRHPGFSTWQSIAQTRKTGSNDERLKRVVIDLAALGLTTPDMLGRLGKGRIYISDNSSGNWGHVNVDDVWVTDNYPSDVNQKPPVWGFADTHTHLAAQDAFDRLLIWGDTHHLLADGNILYPSPCPGSSHYPGSGTSTSKLIYELEEELTFGRSANSGSPVPDQHDQVSALSSKWHSLTHQHMYEKWVFRAYAGGLRLLVTEAVNSRAMAWGLSGNHPDVAPDTDSQSYRVQIATVKAIVNRNSSWMEIALSPADARRIINNNKLAVVLGMEVDSFADFDRATLPSNDGSYYHAQTTVKSISHAIQELQVVYDLGIRQLHPIHLTDNGFGGTAIYNDLFNTSNFYLNGEFFSIENGSPAGVEWRLEQVPQILTTVGFGPIIISKSIGSYGAIIYPYIPIGHVNARGLTNNGRTFIREMMKRGMIIGADHMSDRSLNELIGLSGTALVAHRNYPDLSTTQGQAMAYPIALTHSSSRHAQFTRSETTIPGKLRNEVSKTLAQIRRVNRIGGIASPGLGGDMRRYSGPIQATNDCAGTSRTFAQTFNYYYAKRADNLHGLNFGMPVGTDFNGLNGGLPPRYGKWGCWKQSSHVANSDLTWAMSNPDTLQPQGEGWADYDQRLKQLNNHKGVNYDFYYASQGTYVWHWSPLTPFWISQTHEKMYVQPDQIPIRAAKKSEGNNDWSNHWDINFDGVAHYGMLPDFFQDLRAVGATRENMAPLFLGAEAYIRMWEKAERLRDSGLAD